MLLTNRLKIAQPADRLYESLVDLDGVAPCIPGATLGEEKPDGSREAMIEVAFGPMRFHYDGTVRIAEQDPAARTAVLAADARETSGEGKADAKIGMEVTPAGEEESVLAIETDLRVSGGIAQIGAGMIEEVGQELLEEFGEALGKRDLSAPAAAAGAGAPAGAAGTAATGPSTGAAASPTPAPAAPLQGHRILFRALRRRLRRFLSRGKSGGAR